MTEREYNALREIDRRFGDLDHTVNWGLDYDVARGQAGAAEDATRVPYSVFTYDRRYGVAPTKWLTKTWFRKVNPQKNQQKGIQKFSGSAKVVHVGNPCGGRLPVQLITDRAKRYRANHPDCVPAGPKKCLYCSSGRNVVVHHLDGNEDNGRRSNLAFACKRCNTRIGLAHKRAGKGKRTRQYNGSKITAQQYAWAVTQICRKRDEAKGKCSRSNDAEVLEAVALIRATPASLRRQFAESARRARSRGGRGSEVPF
jgi:hypothetical protein